MKFTTIAFFLIALPFLGNTQIDLDHNLSNAKKIYGLSQFWSEAKYNFAFFDQTEVNWDSAYQTFIPRVLATKNTYEYYREMNRFCALLKDGHTDISRPKSIYKMALFYEIRFQRIDEEIYVRNLSEELVDKIPIGSKLAKVNGSPAMEYLNQEVLPYISASTEHEKWNEALGWRFYDSLKDSIQQIQLSFITPEGKQVDYSTGWKTSRPKFAKQSRPWKRFEVDYLEENIAHIMINTMSQDSVVNDFVAELPKLYQSKGIIIDLRRNGGGNTGIGAEILKYFTSEDLVGSRWKTREYRAAYKAWGMGRTMPEDTTGWSEEDLQWIKEAIDIANGKHWYNGETMNFENDVQDKKIDVPLVVIFGNGTASAAEDFLILLDGLKGRATTIGQKSFGSTGQPIAFKLPGEAWAEYAQKKIPILMAVSLLDTA